MDAKQIRIHDHYPRSSGRLYGRLLMIANALSVLSSAEYLDRVQIEDSLKRLARDARETLMDDDHDTAIHLEDIGFIETRATAEVR